MSAFRSRAMKGAAHVVHEETRILREVVRGVTSERLGPQGSDSWGRDPKHLVFNLARYKFVSKLLAGQNSVLEIGCGDAFGTRIVRAEVNHLIAVDNDSSLIEDAAKRIAEGPEKFRFEVFVHDMLSKPIKHHFDAIYALDVLEHVDPKDEALFLGNATEWLDQHGIGIIGMPSLESQAYASPISKAGHVNCKSGEALKELMQRYFHAVFLFSMSDETVHTGFYPMAHYLMAVCADKK